MKKLKLLTLLPTIAMCACSSSFNPVGTYSFMLGKSTETHVRVAFTLTDEDYKVKKDGQEVVKGKKFKAELDTGGAIEIDIEEMGIPIPEGVDVKELNKKINEIINKILTNIKGYYNVSDYKTTYGNKLRLGLAIGDVIGDVDLPDEALEYLIVSYIDGKYITLQIPVSLNDVIHQLAWYGLYINITDPTKQFFYFLDNSRLPGEQEMEKRLGSHPKTTYESDGKTVKEDQVYEMNYRFGREFSNTPVYIVDQATKKDVLVGKITETESTTVTPEGKEVTTYTHYFHSMVVDGKTWAPSSTVFPCVLYTKNSYGVFDTRYETTMAVDITPIKETGFGKITYIYDMESTESELSRNKYMQSPFTFRDFHDIKMKLTKE